MFVDLVTWEVEATTPKVIKPTSFAIILPSTQLNQLLLSVQPLILNRIIHPIQPNPHPKLYRMSSSTGTGGQYPGQPSGNRSTGAMGGAAPKFNCKNYMQSDHPVGVTVDRNGSICTHCQVSHQTINSWFCFRSAHEHVSVHPYTQASSNNAVSFHGP